MELSKQNQNYFDRIQEIKDKTELVKLWNEIKNSEFVNYYVNIEEIDKNIKEFENLSIEDMRKFLVEILDKNLLYKNYSEMNDEKIGVNEEDKRLNNSFYDKN
jgi:adenine-specific DNA-methyltransferase